MCTLLCKREAHIIYNIQFTVIWGFPRSESKSAEPAANQEESKAMIRIQDPVADFGQDERQITSPRDFLESEPFDEYEENGT